MTAISSRKPVMFFMALVLAGLASASLRAADGVGVAAEVGSPLQAFGAQGISHGTGSGSTGLVGESTAEAGASHGLVARASSPQGFAGLFESVGTANLLEGSANGLVVFSVSTSGIVTASAFVADGRALFQYADLECAACVESGEIGGNGVSTANLAVGSVRTAKIVDDAVGTGELATGAVGASEIGTATVTAAKVATNAILGADLATGAIQTDNFFNGAVGNLQLDDESVTLAKINGVERPVYILASGCRVDSRLTSQSSCFTRVCETNSNFYWDCGSTLCQSHATSQACALNAVGYVLSPDSLP